MNTSSAQVQSSRPFTGGVVLAAALVAVVLMAFGAKFCLEHGLTYTCPSLLLFGLPCPGCGGTRALAALAHLDLIQAIRFNPLVVLCVGLLLVVPFRKIGWENWSGRTWMRLGTLFLLNWVYLLLFLPR